MLETRQGLKIHDSVLQEADILRTTVDMVVCRFPLLAEDNIVLLDDIFNHVGGCQDLLSMLFGISLDTTDLCHMGSPFHFSIVHL